MSKVLVIGPGRFAEKIGSKLQVIGDPTISFTKEASNVISLTLNFSFEVDPHLINESISNIPITAEMGDLFVATLGTTTAISFPDEIHFSYENQDTKFNLAAFAPPVDKGNHGG